MLGQQGERYMNSERAPFEVFQRLDFGQRAGLQYSLLASKAGGEQSFLGSTLEIAPGGQRSREAEVIPGKIIGG